MKPSLLIDDHDGATMITNYHRPQTLEQGMALISRTKPRTLPLGGGTSLSHRQPESVEVVDLQALGLNQINKTGNNLEIGATATIQQLIEYDGLPAALLPALKLEAPLNIRNAASIAGTLVTSDGRSTLATIMMALDAKLIIQPDAQELSVGSLLPLRTSLLQGKLITTIIIPVNVKVAFDYISRTPSDKPIVCATLVRWSSGRTRLSLGGMEKYQSWQWMVLKPTALKQQPATLLIMQVTVGQVLNIGRISQKYW
jgi:CO/xanthine dehydrogenase FAD-binding subunit